MKSIRAQKSKIKPVLGTPSLESQKLNVAVLGGGHSCERNVSLASAKAIISACESMGHRAYFIDPLYPLETKPREADNNPYQPQSLYIPHSINAFAERLMSYDVDVVLNGLHGGWGEDGTIQGVLEHLMLPYSHSGVTASAAAMDKKISRDIFFANNLAVAKGGCYLPEEVANAHVMEPPYVVKPRRGGSSVAVSLVQVGDSPPSAVVLGADWPDSDEVLVEQYIPGRELTCAVVGERALGVIEIITEHNFYDYTAKYSPNGSIHLPANDRISSDLYEAIRQSALRAHQAIGCHGISRTDFRVDDGAGGSNKPIILEINTQPGMTEVSLVPDLMMAEGYSFEDAVQWLIEDAMWHNRRNCAGVQKTTNNSEFDYRLLSSGSK